MRQESTRSLVGPHNCSPADLARIFPDTDHRWLMGLHPIDAATFFMKRDPTGRVCADRAHSLATQPDDYSALTPEAEPALFETVELARSFGVPIDQSLSPAEQLFSLGRTWESDFIWMHATSKTTHRLVGGVLCFPSSWSIREKLGMPMHEVHEPVPGLNAALGQKIETFLSTLAPGTAWGREIAGYSRNPVLNHHPSLSFPPLDATVTIDEIWIRLEHQLLMRLPQSGSILFGIRVEVLPLSQVLEDSKAATGVLRAVSTISSAAADYKGITAARHRIIELIRKAS